MGGEERRGGESCTSGNTRADNSPEKVLIVFSKYSKRLLP